MSGMAKVQALLIVGALIATFGGVPNAFYVSLFWVLPVVISMSLGLSRDRTGWAWGLVLSWLGVLILAIMRPVPPTP
jgi:hypothetical protein